MVSGGIYPAILPNESLLILSNKKIKSSEQTAPIIPMIKVSTKSIKFFCMFFCISNPFLYYFIINIYYFKNQHICA